MGGNPTLFYWMVTSSLSVPFCVVNELIANLTLSEESQEWINGWFCAALYLSYKPYNYLSWDCVLGLSFPRSMSPPLTSASINRMGLLTLCLFLDFILATSPLIGNLPLSLCYFWELPIPIGRIIRTNYLFIAWLLDIWPLFQLLPLKSLV